MTSVKDIGANGTTSRQYKSNSEIKFHCDITDVVSVYNRLLSLPRGQQIVRRLMRPVFMDTRGTGGVNFIRVTPIRRDSTGVIRTFYHQEYFRTAYKYPELFSYYRGDIQLISNHFVLHSRTEYVDWSAEEIEQNKRERATG
eukprot:gene35150-43336_t